MNEKLGSVEFYAFKIAIMLPALFLLFYTLPYAVPYINYYIFIPMVILPLLRFFLKKKIFSYVYPMFTLIFLLVILYSLVAEIGIFHYWLFNYLLITFNFETLVSAMTAFGIMILEEGIITKSIYRVLGSFIFSNLFLLEQYAAIYLMKNPAAISIFNGQPLSYYQAFSAIFYLELLSFYSFIVNGYEYLLPLATLNLPYSRAILLLFLISLVALLLFLYRSDKRWSSERGVNLGYAVVAGSVVGAVAVIFLDRLNSIYYGQSFLLFFVLIMFVVAIRTSRNSYNERIEDEV